MTLAYESVGVTGATVSATAPAVVLPSGLTTDDGQVMFVSTKPFNASCATPSGWTYLADAVSGAVAGGNASGSTRVYAFWRTGSTAATTLTVTSGNATSVHCLRVSKDAANGWITPVAVSGVDGTVDTAVSITTGSLATAAGDLLAYGISSDDDVQTVTSPSYTQTGATLGTATARSTQGATTGNDVGLVSVTHGPVTTGATAALVLAFTQASASDNAGIAVRLREIVPPNAPTSLTATGDADSVLVDWDAPASGTAPTSYNVYRREPNGLTGDDSTFTTSAGSWAANGGSVTVSWNGTALAGRSTTGSAVTNFGVVSGWIALPAGATTIEGSIDAKWVTGTAKALTAYIQFSTNASSVSSVVTGNSATPGTGAYSTITVSAAVPGGQSYYRLRLTGAATGAIGDVFDFDNASAYSAALVGSPSAPTTQYDDTSATAGITYTYWARSVANGLESTDSNTDTGELSASGTSTGSAASTLAAVTQAATGTRTVPTSTGTATSTLAAVTQAATGTRTTPVFTGSSAQTLPALTQAATGTRTTPTWTGTAGSSLAAVTQAATGTSSGPVFTGTAAQTLPAVTQAAQGTFEPVNTGTAASVLPAVTQAATGTRTNPVWTGAAASGLAAVTCSAAGTHTAPVWTGTASSTLPALAQSASGFTGIPTFTGAATSILPALTQSGAGTRTVPTSSGTAVSTLAAVEQSATGTVTAATRTGSAASTLAPLTQTAAGTVTAPAFSGSAASILPALTQSGTGTFTVGVRTGSITSTLPALTQTASGTSTTPGSGGTATSSLPAVTQAAAGTTSPPLFTAVASSVLAAFTQTAAGTRTVPVFSGSAASVLAAVTQAAAGHAFGASGVLSTSERGPALTATDPAGAGPTASETGPQLTTSTPSGSLRTTARSPSLTTA